MTIDEQYMYRCLQLAELGAGAVAPNPLVGAVLVYNGRIIGEGFHAKYGEAHAEVNCLAAVKEEDRKFIAESTMYVSLEPCAHFGKTPPCADRLISEKLPRIVIACLDPFAAVDGKGIDKLKAAGLNVTTGVLEAAAAYQNRRFFTFHKKGRPHITLKWAESADGFMGKVGERTAISNEYSNRLVHKWRSEEASILVGKNTARIDDPHLGNRHWSGPSPVRIVVDMNLVLDASLKLFDGTQSTIVFNAVKNKTAGVIQYVQIEKGTKQLSQIMQALHDRGIQSVLVEGGAALLQSFINENLWDEARIISNTTLYLGNGIKSPHLNVAANAKPLTIASDNIYTIYNTQL